MVENSREEITFVENEIKNTRRAFEEVGCHVFFDEDLCKAIEHILSDYKRVLKETEQLRTEVNSLKKENEELKSKNKTLEEILQGNFNELYKYYKELAGTYQGNSVPIQKVKAKIEGLDIEISTCEYADDDSEEYKQEVEKNKAGLLMAKKVLQQLLESEE